MTNRFIKIVIAILILAIVWQQAYASDLCDRISEIKKLPFKGERIDDDAYNAFIEAGEAAIPCLIERITDTTKTRDPRQTPVYLDVRVGDVAYFVLVRISKIDFVEMMPPDVQKRFEPEGVYAYFEFVQNYKNRKWLQNRVREWYQKNRN